MSSVKQRFQLRLIDLEAPENDNIVMSDCRAELEKHKEFFKNAHGEVLIIGYGIGFCQRYLLFNDKVKFIHCIEKEGEIIAKAPSVNFHPKLYVSRGDGLTYQPAQEYDTIWWDTWNIHVGEIDKQLERYKEYLRPGGWIGRFPT